MNKFERIVQEALVMGGQARIRNTEITVNEIVRLSLDGKSQAEILAQFPNLDAEDVHQALGWHNDYLIDFASRISHEHRSAYTSVRGFAELSLFVVNKRNEEDIEFEKLTEWLITIRDNVIRIQTALQKFRRWIKLPLQLDQDLQIYDFSKEGMEEFLRDEMLKDFSFRYEAPIDEIKLFSRTEPYNLVHILCIAQINDDDENPAGEIIVKKSEQNLLLYVIRVGKLDDHYLSNLVGNIRFGTLLIHESGSELKIQQEENRVIFEFALPIVENP